MKTMFLAALLVCAAALTGAESVPDISHDELLAAVKDKSAVIIDVNGSDSYKEGHIPGALEPEIVAGAGHFLQEDRGAEVGARIRRFVEEAS